MRPLSAPSAKATPAPSAAAPGAAPARPAPRTVSIRGTTYPVVLPNRRDPRLHVAAVIITIHVFGQVALGFRVSVPQILAAILTCAVIEVALTFRQSRAFVWPASAMLTGSGVALILRVVGTPAGDHWTTYDWWLYAAVAGLSLLSKYVIRYRGSHVFNPSNLGLVVAFVLLGTARVEPLDFWWAPLDAWMLAAYAVILGGGLLITRRLRLLGLAAAFWVAFAAGLGLLSASGHCMTASWAFEPVCGATYWRVVVTSPEVMIFLFFMITDPKTVPPGRIGRLLFGSLVAIASTLLMAPQTDEFGTKVALLGGLVLMCAARPLVERFAPAAGSPNDDLRAFAARLAFGGNPASGRPRRVARAGLGAAAMLVLAAGVVAAGSPARGVVVPDKTEVVDRMAGAIDPGTLPLIVVGQDVYGFDQELAGPGMRDVVVTLAQNLEIENQAILHHDLKLLETVDHGDRLIEMQGRVRGAIASGRAVLTHYQFDRFDVSLLVPFGRQTGLSLGFLGRGTMIQETYDASGAVVARRSSPFLLTFAVRRATGARWLDVAVLPPKSRG